ncbi:hypothetical protein CC2G_013733 [Coprinopsis cinerea AmutBmut pab1-1]|nr:hypothetical protein CC2G_013733 [Coprinopsis cinerea AmutBmut pab1-1]
MAGPPISNWVIVDDDNPILQYDGKWETNPEGVAAINRPNRAGPLYNYTARWTTTSGSVSITFDGTWARLQGTTNLTRNSASCSTCPTWTCAVDGQSVPSVEPSFGLLSNRVLCDSGPLQPGSHTLTVDVTGRGDPFWVDFFRYIPSAQASISPPPTLFVDALVPGVQYDSSWTMLANGWPNRMTHAPGAQLNFIFVGTSIAWYGIIPWRSPSVYARAEYSIDGGPPIPFFINDFPESPGDRLTNQLFFKSPSLPDGRHDLNVVYRGDPSSAPLSLDYFIVERGGWLNDSAIEDPGPGGGEGASGGGSQETPAEHGLSKAQLGGIIGGASVAAVLILLLLAYIIYLRRSRKPSDGRYSTLHQPSSAPPVSEMAIHPFHPRVAANTFNEPTLPSSTFNRSIFGGAPVFKTRVTSPGISSPLSPAEGHSGSSSGWSTSGMSTDPEGRTAVQRAQDNPEDRPPVYTPS